MVFWTGILVAAVFAYSAIKLGFYQAWTILVNIVIAVYIGIRLGPAIEEFVPAGGQYYRTLAVLATGVGAFLILQGIAYVFLIGQFSVTFPRGVNMLGSGLAGFLAGFLVWSFAAIVIGTTPLSENTFIKDIGFESKNLEEAKVQPYLVWWCNFVDKLVVSGDNQTSVEQTVKDLLTKPVQTSTKGKTGRPVISTDANEPNYPHGPGDETFPDSHTIIPP
ncbi:MAG: CvpA family protein [Planctomycetota bacterium]